MFTQADLDFFSSFLREPPKVEKLDSDKGVALVLGLPGINSTNTRVTVDGRVVTLSAKPQSIVPEGYDGNAPSPLTYRCKFSDSYDLDQLEAKIQDGQLLVTVPRVASTSREVPIK